MISGASSSSRDASLVSASGIAATVLGAALVACCPAAAFAAAAHTIDDDPTAIVIVLDSLGGFRIAPPAGGADDVVLCVKADGTASISTHTPPERQTWQMPPEALQELVRFLLDEQKFFTLKTPLGRANPGIADAGGWMIRISADGKTHTVRAPMMAHGAAGEARKRFDRCLTRLQGVMTIVSLGGDEPANRFLEAANAVFAKEWPKEQPLTLADIGPGSVLANGAVSLTFVRDKRVLSVDSPTLDGPTEVHVVSR